MAWTGISPACRSGRCRKMTGSAARRGLVGGTARARRLDLDTGDLYSSSSRTTSTAAVSVL